MGKKKIVSVLLAFALCLSAFNFSSSADFHLDTKVDILENRLATTTFVLLDVPKLKQEETKWCWVTAGLMAGKYMSPIMNKTQSALVIDIKGSYVNEPGTIFEAARAMELSTYPVQSVSPKITGYFSWPDTRKSIDNGYPLLAFVNSSAIGKSGHFYVIKGYSETGQLKLNDPWDGKEKQCSWYGFTTGNWEDSRPYQNSVYYNNWNK